MMITLKWLEKQGACGGGKDRFNGHFPEGGNIDAVLVLITQYEDAEDGWVSWLMQHAKYTDLGWLEGLGIPGSLNLSGTGITSLPDGLTVGGYLDLNGTGITSLPDGLTV